MQDLFNIILPVFLVIGIGYLGTRRNYITGEQIDGLHVNHTMTGVAIYPPGPVPGPES